MSSNDFQALLARARAGDNAAWEQLFARLGGAGPEAESLRRAARAILPRGDRARGLLESQDLVQSALRSGWFHAAEFRGETETDLLGWIRAIVRRKLSRAVRRRRPQPGGETLAIAGAVATPGSEDPPALLASREDRERVRAALAALPEDQRTVMELRLEGLRAPDIAGMLGLAPAAVRKRESRALERLRELLGES